MKKGIFTFLMLMSMVFPTPALCKQLDFSVTHLGENVDEGNAPKGDIPSDKTFIPHQVIVEEPQKEIPQKSVGLLLEPNEDHDTQESVKKHPFDQSSSTIEKGVTPRISKSTKAFLIRLFKDFNVEIEFFAEVLESVENMETSEQRDEVKDLDTQNQVTEKSSLLDKAPHVLVIGGIQGDEPGGFTAASLLATRYHITRGFVTVVPNLNFFSIIRRNRGIYGDMNRKFAQLEEDDPEYDTVRRIQEMIVAPDVDLVLNLHDGSGFYHPEYISKWQNPNRWGNSVIIDQAEFDAPRFGDLRNIASIVVEGVNEKLLDKGHTFHVHDTETAKGNAEMAKSLTWFALGQGKPAFGLEASKNLSVPERSYYHLSMLEHMLHHAGVEFTRPFELTPSAIKQEMATGNYISFMQNRLVLPLTNARKEQVGRLPFTKEDMDCISNNPIITAITDNGRTQVHYGNNHTTSFLVDWHELDSSLDTMKVVIDDVEQEIPFGSHVYAKDYFLIKPVEGYRVNAIGAVLGNGVRGDESDKKIRKQDFPSRFSVDKAGTSFRVEVYSGKKYAGTFIVQYQ